MADEITRKEAASAGLTHYFTGKPCKRGHLAPRNTRDRGCILCSSERQLLRAKRPPPPDPSPHKTCTKCGNVKPITEFLAHQNMADGRLSFCRACKYRREDYLARRARQLLQDEAGLRKREREQSKRWRRTNPEKAAVSGHLADVRRRQRAKAGGDGFSATDIRRLLRQQKRRCWWCGGKLISGYHIDHRFPLAKSGRHDASNIVISCVPCNLRKGTKTPWEFAGRLL